MGVLCDEADIRSDQKRRLGSRRHWRLTSVRQTLLACRRHVCSWYHLAEYERFKNEDKEAFAYIDNRQQETGGVRSFGISPVNPWLKHPPRGGNYRTEGIDPCPAMSVVIVGVGYFPCVAKSGLTLDVEKASHKFEAR